MHRGNRWMMGYNVKYVNSYATNSRTIVGPASNIHSHISSPLKGSMLAVYGLSAWETRVVASSIPDISLGAQSIL